VRALDFASLGGFPVALAEDGLYAANLPTGAAGGAAPLVWQPIARGLPDLPTVFADGLLEVESENGEETLYLYTPWGRVFRIASAPGG
jgi:hypothetical protein